ncbi:hypothetical protein T484DRAFT_1898244, partial [Baffinella frigidus]
MSTWWSNNTGDEDDDLQKALRASLADIEGGSSHSASGDPMDEDAALPDEVQEAYKKVLGAWERQRRIFWSAVDTALGHVLGNYDHARTTGFVAQMLPEIVSICVTDCTWADIIQDSSTKEDYTDAFTSILEGCVNTVGQSLRRGSPSLMEPLNSLLDPAAPLYNKDGTTGSGVHTPAPVELLPRLRACAVAADLPATVGNCLKHWRFLDCVQGVRFLARCDDGSGSVQVLSELASTGVSAALPGSAATEGTSATCAAAARALAHDALQRGVAGSKSDKFVDRMAALPAMAAGVEALTLLGDGAFAVTTLDAEGVIQDLFGERAHDRIVLEALPLLRALALPPERLDPLLEAALGSGHDPALRAAANVVAASLLETLPSKGRLHLIAATSRALDDPERASAAAELSSSLAGARVAGNDRSVIVKGTEEEAQAMLRLTCQVACSEQAWREERVAQGAIDALRDLLKSGGGGTWDEDPAEPHRRFVLSHCVEELSTLQQERLHGGRSGGEDLVSTRGLYAVLRSVVEMYPQTQHAIVDFIIEDLSLLAPSSTGSTSNANGSNGITINGSNVALNGSTTDNINGSNNNGSNGGFPRTSSAERGLSRARSLSPTSGRGAAGAELWERLELLRFMVEQSDGHLLLGMGETKRLWKALQGCSTVLFGWLRLAQDAGGVLSPQAQALVLSETLALPPATLRT